MPYVTVGKENSGNIELHYDDHGSGCLHSFEAGHRVIGGDSENRAIHIRATTTIPS
jgi:hypothetical protein